jgi:hypothetical protein
VHDGAIGEEAMKSSLGWIIAAVLLGATALMLTMSARAQEPDVEPEAPAEPVTDEGTVLLQVEGTVGADDAAAPSAQSAQQIHDSLVAISPGAGLPLPPPEAVDTHDWQTAEAGAASMRLPADWTVQNRIGNPGDDDQTVGLSPSSNDLYVELRVIRNADSNYLQQLGEHARSEYSRSPDRYAEHVILGYQPRMQAGAAGHIEVMNQFGKEVDDDGNRTFRLILWRGRWEENGDFHRVEFSATFAQDDYDRLASMVAAILDTVEIRATAVAEAQ